jgi:hypothetical protein
MIIEYDMIEGGKFKELISGFLIYNDQCAYVNVIGTLSSVTLPQAFKSTEQLVQLELES